MYFFFFFKQKTAYEMRISDWSSDVCSSDLHHRFRARGARLFRRHLHKPCADLPAGAGELADTALGRPVAQPERSLGVRRLDDVAEEQQVRLRQGIVLLRQRRDARHAVVRLRWCSGYRPVTTDRWLRSGSRKERK